MASEPAARLLIVADDLTGALDTAGAFAARGIVTKVVARPVTCDPQVVREAQVVSINTSSRHLPPEEADAQVRRCTARFASQHFDHVYKKVDSTLRGSVVAETLALMQASGRKVALVAPAFPAQGRTVINGVVHVEGVPLAQTGFAHDALSPPPLDPLNEVFAAAIGQQQVSTWHSGQALPSVDAGVVIADAENGEHMVELFDRASARLHRTLLVGSAGLGEILADRLQGNNGEASVVSATPGPIVFVIGSRAARSREQVERLQREPHTIVIDAPNGVVGSSIEARPAAQVALLATDDPDGEIAPANVVAQRLAQAGLAMVARLGAEAIVVTGGDTAIAVLEESACDVLDVCGNLMPGIPFSRFEWSGRPIYLVTKAGGFGTRDTFVDIVRCFRRGTGEAGAAANAGAEQ